MNPKLYCFQCMNTLNTEDENCPNCGYDNHIRTNGAGFLPFSTVKNRYLIGKALGRGGFGVTYIGLDLSLERRVAIKEYLPGELVIRAHDQSMLTPYDEASRETFERGRERSMQEARTIARLNDVPDAVNVFDVFIANNTLYIVMEFIEGETLRAQVKREGGKLSPQAAVDMLLPIFASLTLIHKQGIIHRDISPDNIMFRKSSGRAVLLDFGAAHNLQLEAESEHSTSLRPGYAPVEQYSKNGLQDARTDEYALCATLYYAITGQKPVASMERSFGDATLQPPSALGIEISQAFEAVLMKGLSIQAKDRYDDIPALEAAFREAARSVSEPVPIPDPVPIPEPVIPPVPAPNPTSKGQKMLVLGLMLTCIALAAVSFGLWQRGNISVEANKQDTLIQNGTSLVYCAVDKNGAVKVADGVTHIQGYAFGQKDTDGKHTTHKFTSLTLPRTLKMLDLFSLSGFQGKELRIPDGVLLRKWLMSASDTNEYLSLQTITLGKNILLDSEVTDSTTVFPKFNGTLYLADGSTMKTLVGLFPEGSKYTLSCQRGAVPKSGIPKGVKVTYRK